MNTPEEKMSVLLCEDDENLGMLLREYLQAKGYDTELCPDGEAGYRAFTQNKYDLCVLDVMMPKMDGVQVLQRLREEGVRTPVMMLTAKSGKDDRITGFNAGADDYLPKPFEPDELICRVRAMLRRGGTYQPTVLAFGDVTLDPGSGVLSCCGRSVRLSGREFQVMELFLRSPQVVLSADRIMERVWGWDSEAEINVVWVHISNLRKKLRSIGSHVTIRASRGLGYLLEVEV